MEFTLGSFSGAFLVPLILCIIVVSTPLIFLEFSLGQFASLGPLAIWRVAPLFKGKNTEHL